MGPGKKPLGFRGNPVHVTLGFGYGYGCGQVGAERYIDVYLATRRLFNDNNYFAG